MNIQKIKIANILGIEELVFEPGKFTLIEGRNGSGKTSILESIKHVLNGGHDAKLLRNGTDRGEIVLVLDDGIQLTKTITPNKSDVKVLDKEGNTINKPQTYIDKLIDVLSINPVQFLTADRKNRVDYLLEAIPMKLTREHLQKFLSSDVVEKLEDDLSGHALEVIDGIYKRVYDERTGINRALKEKVATMIQLKESAPDAAGYSSDELLEKLKTLENKKGDMEAKKTFYLEEAVRFRIKRLSEEEKKFQEAMMRIREEYENRKQEIFEEYEKQKNKIQMKFDEKYLPLLDDIARLKEKLQQSKSQEKTRELIEQFSHECSELKNRSTKLTQMLNALEDLKKSLLKNLPIEGLEIKDGEIYYNNIIFDKLNTAEQVKIAIELAKIRAGRLGIICVDGLEKLDRATFEEFKNKAIESGLQMIVTRVNDSELNIQTEAEVT